MFKPVLCRKNGTNYIVPYEFSVVFIYNLGKVRSVQTIGKTSHVAGCENSRSVQSTCKETLPSLNSFDLFNTIWSLYIIMIFYFIAYTKCP